MYFCRCCCVTCQNPMMLFDCLKKAKLIAQDEHLDVLVNSSLTGDQNLVEEFQQVLSDLQEGPLKNKAFQYRKWEKVIQPAGKRTGVKRKGPQLMPKTSTVGQAAEEMSTSLASLIPHLERAKKMKQIIKEKREAVQEPGSRAVMVHMDWADGYCAKVN